MAIDEHGYRALVGQPASYIRQSLSAEAYGAAEHPQAWCLTDVLRLDARIRWPILDAIIAAPGGRKNSDPAKRLRIKVRLKSVTGEPVTLRDCEPQGDPQSAGRGNAAFDEGQAHHSANQHKVVEYEYAPDAEYDLIDPDMDCHRSASWLLQQYGWMARHGGRGARRHTADQYGKDTVDQWRFVEDAFCTLHPELDPLKGGGPSKERVVRKVVTASESGATPKRTRKGGATAEAA